MTNRQYLNTLDDTMLLKVVKPLNCPPGTDFCRHKFDEVPCEDCWFEWLGAECDRPITAIYDVVEEHKNCTVQVLKNSVTGEMSVGWKKNE